MGIEAVDAFDGIRASDTISDEDTTVGYGWTAIATADRGPPTNGQLRAFKAL
jgi:hypothetical protein